MKVTNQAQYSTAEQVEELKQLANGFTEEEFKNLTVFQAATLISLANRRGLYDAADYLLRQIGDDPDHISLVW